MTPHDHTKHYAQMELSKLNTRRAIRISLTFDKLPAAQVPAVVHQEYFEVAAMYGDTLYSAAMKLLVEYVRTNEIDYDQIADMAAELVLAMGLAVDERMAGNRVMAEWRDEVPTVTDKSIQCPRHFTWAPLGQHCGLCESEKIVKARAIAAKKASAKRKTKVDP
jgi:hypothetical protein